jgi:hypothetical protein
VQPFEIPQDENPKDPVNPPRHLFIPRSIYKASAGLLIELRAEIGEIAVKFPSIGILHRLDKKKRLRSERLPDFESRLFKLIGQSTTKEALDNHIPSKTLISNVEKSNRYDQSSSPSYTREDDEPDWFSP